MKTLRRWIVHEEVPFDDGTPTGYGCVMMQEAVAVDPHGEPDWFDVEYITALMPLDECEAWLRLNRVHSVHFTYEETT